MSPSTQVTENGRFRDGGEKLHPLTLNTARNPSILCTIAKEIQPKLVYAIDGKFIDLTSTKKTFFPNQTLKL